MRDLKEYWETRYKIHGPSGAGTFTHTEATNRWFYTAKERRLRHIFRKVGIDLSGRRVLDVACGAGMFVPFFRSLGALEVVGVDISESGVAHCRSRFAADSHCVFEVCDFTSSLPHPSQGSFDLACIFEAIFLVLDQEHFERGLRNLARSIRTGGHLVVSDRFPSESIPRHARMMHWSLPLYTDILSSEGMSIDGLFVQTRVFDRHLFPIQIQRILEHGAPWALFALDQFAVRLFPKDKSGTTIKYLVATKRR